jgi:hypothetical protein
MLDTPFRSIFALAVIFCWLSFLRKEKGGRLSAANWIFGATAIITAVAVILTVPVVAKYVDSFSEDSWAQVQAWILRIGLPVAETFAAYVMGFSFARWMAEKTTIRKATVNISPKQSQLGDEVHFEVSFDSEKLRYGFVEVITISPYGERTVISPYIINDRGTLKGIFNTNIKTRLRWVIPHTAAIGEYAIHVNIGSYVLLLNLRRKKHVFRSLKETFTIRSASEK